MAADPGCGLGERGDLLKVSRQVEDARYQKEEGLHDKA